MAETSRETTLKPTGFHLARAKVVNIVISCHICIWIVIGFIAASDQFRHWFVIPVLFCGILIGIDAVDWLRGQLNIFDPVGTLGLLGFHFFFLAPLLHVHWDQWLPPYIMPPADWRYWLGVMAFLNALGLIWYRFSRNAILKYEQKQSSKTFWRLDKQKFFVIVSLALLVTGGLQILVYVKYGGVTEYVQLASERAVVDVFAGMGWVFMISDSFPILILMAFAIYGKEKNLGRSWAILAVALLVFFALKMLFGGLAGSRGNTIWGLLWAAGIIHFWNRPISRKLILFGCVLLILFMYCYGFFKAAGLDSLKAFESAEARDALSKETGRTFQYLLLNDLGRSEIQAFVLYRLLRPESDYKYAWGRTYLGALALFIHRSIWPERPPSKLKEGTEILYGMGSFLPGRWETSAVFGLAGETMLNFGPFVVPLSFLIFGFLVGRLRRLLIALEPADSRLLLLPFLLNLCFVILVADSDNVLFFLVKNGTLPFAVLALSSTKLVVTRSSVLNS